MVWKKVGLFFQRNKEALPVTVLSLLPFLCLFKVFSEGSLLFGSDTLLIFYPYRKLGFEELRQGHILLWNPYLFCGMPFLGEIQTTLLYPLNFLFFLFPTDFAITLTLLLHLFLSGVFAYGLGRSLNMTRWAAFLAGLVYQFSGFQMAHLYAGHQTITYTYTFIPLLFWGLGKTLSKRSWRWAVLTGVALALQILAGYPGITYYTALGLLFYAIARSVSFLRQESNKVKTVGIFFGLGMLILVTALSLSAFQLLPTLDAASQSTREGGMPYEFGSSFSLPSEHLLTFLMPDFFGDGVRVAYWGRWYWWEFCGYVGVLALVLAFVGVFFPFSDALMLRLSGARLFFTFLSIIALILSLGRYLSCYPFIYRLLPGLTLFRGPSRALVLWTLSIALLAGFGIDRLRRNGEKADAFLRQLVLWLTAFSVISMVLFVLFSSGGKGENIFWKLVTGHFLMLGSEDERLTHIDGLHPQFLQASFQVSQESLFRFVLLLTFCSTWLWLGRHPVRESRWVLLGVLLVFFDLATEGSKYVKGTDAQRALWDKSLVAFLKEQEEPFRVWNLHPEISDNGGMAHKVAMIGGFDPFVANRFAEYVNFNEGRPLKEPLLIADFTKHTKLLDLLNAKFVLTEPKANFNDPKLKPVFEDEKVKVWENIASLPRVWIAQEFKVVRDKKRLLKTLRREDFDPHRTVLLERSPPSWWLSVKGKEKAEGKKEKPLCRILRYEPERVEVLVKVKKASVLVLADAYAKGWKAWLNGKSIPFYRANYLMRAVFLPKGEQTVTFTYEPAGFRWGAFVSGLAWMALFLFAVIEGLRRWRRRQPA